MIRTKFDNKENKKIASSEDLLKLMAGDPMGAMKYFTKTSLYSFVRYFWDTYSEDQFQDNWHIKIDCEELEKVARRVAAGEENLYDLIINQPPGTTKTAIVSIFFPVWCWVNWQWMRFITTSHTSKLSLESAEYSRDIIRSDKFKELFPEIGIKQDKDTKTNFRIVRKTFDKYGQVLSIKPGGGRISTSIDSKVTGFHAHIIIVDDLLDPKAAISQTAIQDAKLYIDQTLSTRKTNKNVSSIIFIMQRLAIDDPTGHLLEKKRSKIRHICLPGEIIHYKDQVHPPELVKYYVNGLFDTKRLNWNALEKMENDLGEFGYSAQVGQKPIKAGGNLFKVEHFRILETAPSPTNIVRVVRAWDKAGTAEKELRKGKDAKYTVGLKMALLANGKWVILDVIRGRWSADEREDIIRQTAEADGVEVEIVIEQEPGSGGKESAEATIRNLAGFNIEADLPKGDKNFRAQPFAVQVNKGNVLLLRSDWNSVLISEFGSFPLGTYKDQVDAGSMAFNRLVSFEVAGRVV